MKFKIASLVVLLCGGALFVGSMIKSRSTQAKAKTTPRSFIIHYLASRSDDQKPLTPYEYRVRAVSSTGEWKETRYSFDGKISTWGATKEGLFSVNGNARQYFGDYDMEVAKNAMRSEEDLKKHPQLVRTEQIAGLRAYVLRDVHGSEGYYSPETGKTILKEIIPASPNTDTIVHLTEALKVEFRDLSEDEAQLPDLPLRFDLADDKVRTLREAGQSERADRLQQAINKFKVGQK